MKLNVLSFLSIFRTISHSVLYLSLSLSQSVRSLRLWRVLLYYQHYY